MSVNLDDFTYGLCETFRIMVEAELDVGPIEAISPADRIFADISAHLPITGDRPACVVLTMNSEMAVKIVSTVSGLDAKFDDEIVPDAVGELLNMVVGTTQRRATARFGYNVPVLTKGHRHEVKILARGPGRRVISRLEGHEVGLYLVEGVNESDVLDDDG